VENDSDFGLAFDGDADRLIAVDEHGALGRWRCDVVCGGKIPQKQGELHENTVVTTVMANWDCTKH
jgi:phosphoglucosamine mutase